MVELPGHPWFFGCSVAVFVVYPPMYYVVISDPRYRYPILWMSLLGFGYAVERLHARASGAVTVK